VKYQKPSVYLRRAGVPFARQRHPSAETAQDLARALGISGYQVAKTVVVEADGGTWMAVVPAPEVVDLQRLAAILAARSIRVLEEHEFAGLFQGCEVGTQPPLGKLYSVPLVVDGDLAEEPEIAFLAGSHQESFKLRFRDFSRLEAPLIADFSVLPAASDQATLRVKDLMTRDVASCHAQDPLSVAARLMWNADCGVIPVLEPDGDRVVGMITDRDICMAAFFQNRAPAAISVAQAMSNALYVCSPSDSVAHAEDILRAHQIRRLPVVTPDGHLEGILSLADIVRRVEPNPDRRPVSAAQDITSTLGEICQPRASIAQLDLPRA
jgi:Ala-tRNA(Pro) deacylase